MRLFKVLLMVGLVSCLYGCSNEEHASKEELMETIERFNQAFQVGNVAVLDSLVAEDYVHTNGSSKSISRKDWFNYLGKREEAISSGSLEVLDYKMEEVEIELYKATAIVTGKVMVSSRVNGEVKENEYRVTHIWVNVDGNWKRAGFHDGKIK